MKLSKEGILVISLLIVFTIFYSIFVFTNDIGVVSFDEYNDKVKPYLNGKTYPKSECRWGCDPPITETDYPPTISGMLDAIDAQNRQELTMEEILEIVMEDGKF